MGVWSRCQFGLAALERGLRGVSLELFLGGGGGTYGKRALEGDLVLLDALDGRLGDRRLAVLELGRDVDGLPGDGRLRAVSAASAPLRFRAGDVMSTETAEGEGGSSRTNLGGSEDALDGAGDLGTDAVALDQADGVVTLRTNGQFSLLFRSGRPVGGKRERREWLTSEFLTPSNLATLSLVA